MHGLVQNKLQKQSVPEAFIPSIRYKLKNIHTILLAKEPILDYLETNPQHAYDNPVCQGMPWSLEI